MKPLTREEVMAEAWIGDQRERVLALLDRAEVAERGCQALSAQLNEANAAVLRWRALAEQANQEARREAGAAGKALADLDDLRQKHRAHVDQLLKDLGG